MCGRSPYTRPSCQAERPPSLGELPEVHAMRSIDLRLPRQQSDWAETGISDPNYWLFLEVNGRACSPYCAKKLILVDVSWMKDSLPKYFPVLILRPFETNFICQKSLCRCSEDRHVDIRLFWITRMGPKSNDRCPHDRQKRHIQGRRQCRHRSKDQSDVVTNQGTVGATTS